MPHFSQGEFTPRHPNKYVGKGRIKYRSSWELTVFQFCDTNQHISEWASESISIPYRNPITGKHSRYIPDLLIRYNDKSGKQHVELVEIKPRKQSILKEGLNSKERAVVLVNYAKWEAARAWCKRNGLQFRVITEREIFSNGRK